jgi:hypothetical protein
MAVVRGNISFWLHCDMPHHRLSGSCRVHLHKRTSLFAATSEAAVSGGSRHAGTQKEQIVRVKYANSRRDCCLLRTGDRSGRQD